jgi:hypothetical protein
MSEKLEQLKALLSHKKSKAFYAKRLNITETEVDDLLRELRRSESANYTHADIPEYPITWTTTTADCFIGEFTKRENLEKGTLETTSITDYAPKSVEELVELHKVDTKRYKVSNYWTKQRGDKFFSSLFCTLIKENSQEKIKESFEEFLKTYKPFSRNVKKPKASNQPSANLILPKQDAHFNKFDVYGNNDIETRFAVMLDATINTVEKAKLSNSLEQITYIVGSDQFNSEWTSMTTKFTPQQNILSFHEAFENIAQHEVDIIEYLSESSENVEVVFIPGNHDEYVGWHLIKWLEAYFRGNLSIVFDSSPLNRKYIKYGNSAIMINHGDVMKPVELAQTFPMEFKDQWSECDYYYVLVGDKHHEMSKDIKGIKFYQVPQLSSAKSGWDDKHGHTCSKSEMQAFLITEDDGLTDIYRQTLKY